MQYCSRYGPPELFVQAYLGDIPDYPNKVDIALKRVARNVWFPGARRSDVYIILWSSKCAIALCLKNTHALI